MCEIKILGGAAGVRLYCDECDEGITYLLHGSSFEGVLEKVQAHLRPVHVHEWESLVTGDWTTGTMSRVNRCVGCGRKELAR